MNGFESYQKCPKCGETKNILTEKRPFGDSRCGSCGFKAKTLLFAVPKKPFINVFGVAIVIIFKGFPAGVSVMSIIISV